MAKIVFIYPAYENLGIEYLSAALKKSGHQTFLILDPVLFNEAGFLNFSTLSRVFDYGGRIKKELDLIRPDLVAFSVASDNFQWALKRADEIRKFSTVPIIFGGIHPTSVPEEVIQYNCLDFLCVGEGEDALVELANCLTYGQIDYSIKNLWFKRKGEIIQNSVRSLKLRLDELSPPDKGLYYNRYRFVMNGGYTVITSRGCPHSCTYCCNSILRKIYQNKGEYLRRRSVQSVFKELEIAKERYCPKYIHFVDEVFTYDKIWLKEFIFLYSKSIRLPFACYLSPQFVDKDIADLLKEGGCYKVQMGVQTINEDDRVKLLNRHYSNAQVSFSIRQFKQKKIYITCDNIFGLPTQDETELIRMAEFYCENKPNFIEVFWLRYYPRTKIIDIAQKLGCLDKEKIDRIEKSLDTLGIAKGGDTYRPKYVCLQLLMNLFHFIPQFWRRVLLRKKIYKFFPKVNPVFIGIFFRLFNKAKFDLYTSRTFRRYVFFILDKIFPLTRRIVGLKPKVIIPCPLCGRKNRHIVFIHGSIKIFKCKVCGIVFRERGCENMDNFALNSESYRMVSRSSAKIRLEEKRFERIIKYVKKGSSKIKIFEIGAGCGVLGKIALEQGVEYWGVEPSRFFYEEANNNITDGGGKLFNACLNEIRFKDESFDIVVMNDVLEHIVDPKGQIEICLKVLKKGGFIYIEVPDDSFFLLKYFLAKIFKKGKIPILPPGHINIFSRAALLRLFCKDDFRDIKICYRGLLADKDRISLVLGKEKLSFYIRIISFISRFIKIDILLRQRIIVCRAFKK